MCHNTRKTSPCVKAKVAIGRCLSYIRTSLVGHANSPHLVFGKPNFHFRICSKHPESDSGCSVFKPFAFNAGFEHFKAYYSQSSMTIFLNSLPIFVYLLLSQDILLQSALNGFHLAGK